MEQVRHEEPGFTLIELLAAWHLDVYSALNSKLLAMRS